MAEKLDVLNAAVSLLIRAVLLAARFSGRVRRSSLQWKSACKRETFEIVSEIDMQDRIIASTDRGF